MENILMFFTFSVYVTSNLGDYEFDECYKSREDAVKARKRFANRKGHDAGRIHTHRIDLDKHDIYHGAMAQTLEYYSHVYFRCTNDILYI